MCGGSGDEEVRLLEGKVLYFMNSLENAFKADRELDQVFGSLSLWECIML